MCSRIGPQLYPHRVDRLPGFDRGEDDEVEAEGERRGGEEGEGRVWGVERGGGGRVLVVEPVDVWEARVSRDYASCRHLERPLVQSPVNRLLTLFDLRTTGWRATKSTDVVCSSRGRSTSQVSPLDRS